MEAPQQVNQPINTPQQDPYIVPPPAPNKSRTTRKPLTNTLIIAAVILVGGFMAYNYVGNSLTQLAGDSYTASPTPTLSPTPTEAFR